MLPSVLKETALLTIRLGCLPPSLPQVADLESQLAAASAEREEQRQLLASLSGSLAAAQEARDAAEARAAELEAQVGPWEVGALDGRFESSIALAACSSRAATTAFPAS